MATVSQPDTANSATCKLMAETSPVPNNFIQTSNTPWYNGGYMENTCVPEMGKMSARLGLQ